MNTNFGPLSLLLKRNHLIPVIGSFALGIISGHAQVLEQWTHQAPIGESSAVVALDENYMLVGDNEDESLRLYARFPATLCSGPLYALDVHIPLGLSYTKPEDDIESAVRVLHGDSTRVYWLGSHSNSKTGNLRPNRERIFATEVLGDGTGSPPYTLGYLGRYDQLRADLIAWDRDNLHAQGSNYFGLAASAAAGIAPERIDGFNIEGLTMAPDGKTAYLAFRSPLVNGVGPTISWDQRTNALVVPLLNLPDLVAGNPVSGPGTARFGAPFTLDLGGRGVRSVDCSTPGQYIITAGPTGDTSNPPTDPYNFRLFVWSGNPSDPTIQSETEFPAGLSPEGAIVGPGPITRETVVQFVSDDGGGCWRSFTAYAGATLPLPIPRLKLTQSLAANGENRLVIEGAPGSYALQASTNLADWITLADRSVLDFPFTFVDRDAASFPIRFYRVQYEK